ncbi:cytochrome b/b6 domain-containing protein [Ramlibacter sp. USB13]|uniref:Cytochrome b/b6 domain-containing protein n=1 Tax=Ramlibacter cellulosilyticus TaxID=2764187 RepID=A0A923MSM1_9BURK|nr:cytochrome b/b6 domain-containing protein [Ramlibacter cellulosilyticus]MBC5784715.1 cytochrome b/b6 domain-containing protein [Ramlibacter cellulosilyticus]
MNTVSASPAERKPRTLVWDLPTRLFHWLLAGSFAVAWISAESERWQLVHVTAGYTVAGLVVFRLLWGLVGTRHARFTDFVRGPRAVLGYLRSLASGRPEHHAGHNPAGALAIVGLLALAALTTATGWANYADLGGHWLEEVHEALASGMLALVAVHIVAVVVSSRLHHENLVASMVHGRKPVPPTEGIRSARRTVGALMLVAVLGFWWTQWQSAPANGGATPFASQAEEDD